MSTESEGVGKHGVDVAFLSLVEGEVEVIVHLGVVVAFHVVDCGGHDSVGYGLHAEKASSAPAAPRRWPVIDLVELRLIL